MQIEEKQLELYFAVTTILLAGQVNRHFNILSIRSTFLLSITFD